MIFRTLYSRLALTLFVLLCVVGVILIQLIEHSSAMYQQEVSQKLNSDLAAHIVTEQSLILNKQVNHQALDALFHQLMVTNPSIELYLLGPRGDVLGYSAPDGSVKRSQVDMVPIKQFLDRSANYPIEGDDPRNPAGRKVFSAASITDPDGLQGYLYIILGSQQYDHIAQMLSSSYILDSTLVVLMAALAAALLGGLIVFALQTRRLRQLGIVMHDYAGKDPGGNNWMRYPDHKKTHDEIDLLGRQFNAMAEKIDTQVHELRKMDNMRRELVANISHDLRTPLTTMRGYLETLLLKNSELSEQEKKQHLETALKHGQHLGELVEGLFELARLDSCESVVYSEPFSMCELVQDVAQMYDLRAQQKAIQLDIDMNLESPLVYGDIAMMQRVMENLLENGLQHTPEGGQILISVDVDSGNVVVKVADSGSGIPAKDMPRIFDRFYQQDTNRSGSEHAGLGLAIVKRILELHGSIIKVRSDINQGTTFSFQMTTSPSV